MVPRLSIDLTGYILADIAHLMQSVGPAVMSYSINPIKEVILDALVA